MGVIGTAMRSHSRGTDAVPRPHSLRVPVTDCVRGDDGLSYPHERAFEQARGAHPTSTFSSSSRGDLRVPRPLPLGKSCSRRRCRSRPNPPWPSLHFSKIKSYDPP